MDFVDGGAGQQPLLLLVGKLLFHTVHILPAGGLGKGSIELFNVVGSQLLHLAIADIELLGELVAAMVVKVGRVDIKDKLAVVGGIRLQTTGGNRAVGFHPGEQVSVVGGWLFEIDVPFCAVGKNVGVSIAVLFALIVLLGVANSFVRNSEISDACAVDAIVSCQRASLLSGFRGR